MNRIRALIVDDEPLARQRIQSLLAEYDDVDVIGECVDGRHAIAAIQSQKPDLVFLDIQMPEIDGFGVVGSIVLETRPAIIFVTAYNQHAIRAFDINALDYLLKPFDRARFMNAIQRARKQLAYNIDQRNDFEQRMLSALEQLPNQGFTDRIIVKLDNRLVLLDVDSIDWIEAAGKFVLLHTGNSFQRLKEPLGNLEARLDPKKFVRIHRSTVVNLDSIKSLEPMFHGEYCVWMKSGKQLTLSRSYRAKLRERFGNLI